MNTPISKEQFDQVCDEIETTEHSVNTICVQLGIAKSSFYKYIKIVGTEAKNQYVRSKYIQTHLIADDIIDIADDGSNDLMTIVKGDLEYTVENKEVTNRSKLRVDARKWVLAHLNPKEFGDKLDVTTNNESINRQFEIIPVSNKPSNSQ